MAKKKWMRIFNILVVAGMIFGGVAPLSTTAQEPTPTAPALNLSPGGAGVTPDPFSKLDSELRSLAAEGGEEAVEVYILAKVGADLSRVAEVSETRPFPDGAELVVATVKPDQIEKLASHPDVVAAEVFHAIEAPIPLTPREEAADAEVEAARQKAAELRQTAFENVQRRSPRDGEPDGAAAPEGVNQPSAPSMPEGITAPDDWYGVDLIGAKAAWAKGYTGEGVNIAILDSGVDFGHPDLDGTQAVYEDGPYEGWPIALDPRSMRSHYYYGYDSWTNYYNYYDYSWYAEVGNVILCSGSTDEVFSFNGYDYTIAQEIAALSKSGTIRWSVHPDAQLYYFVYDWAPFILVDANVAGVYDTVIADLNFDLWFDEHDQMTTKDNPVMGVDLGGYLTEPTVVEPGTLYVPDWFTRGWKYPPMWWGMPQNEGYWPQTVDPAGEELPAGTWIWAPNHWTPDGATTLQDGIADVSGGMVYYIADGVLPVPGMDYLYPGFGPAGKPPIPLNGQLVAFMLGSYFVGGFDHGTLCASAAVAGGQIMDTQAATGERVQYDPGSLMDELFFDDFEAGSASWDQTGLWHLQADSACLTPGYNSPETAAVFNDEATCSFATGAAVSGTLTTFGPFFIPFDSAYAELSFWSFEETECGGGCFFDRRIVEASIDGGASWSEVWNSYYGSWEGFWYERNLDLTAFHGYDVLLRFRFDSIDSIANDYRGWYVDDVQVDVVDYLKPADEGVVQGPAPGAKIIAIGDNYRVINGMQGFYDAYTFLAYGVDGVPNSGDEFVDLASMSYGDGTVHNDGWDWESRMISYYNQQYLPNTTFFASSGNGGPGFGTVNSPQGNTVVTVGASTQYGVTDVFGGGLSIDQLNDGDIVHFSGRGPDALGRPDPDVVATGGWGAGNTPVNLAYGYGGGSVAMLDGGNAWYEWGGTSRSAPEAAGVMATIYQAYKQANGAFPDFEIARQILMSGAQDLKHDVLRQGAGRVNADTGTDIAAGLGGVYVSPSLLAAGEYKGTQYESFGNVLFPGDTWTQTFTVKNPGATAATVSLGDEMMVEMETQTFDQVVKPYLGTEGPYPDTYFYWADYLVSADPDLAVGYAMLRVGHASPDAPPVEVCVNGSTAINYLEFGEITGYIPLPPDDYFVQVFVFDGIFDCGGVPVIEATLPLAPFTDYTVVATDFVADITPVVLVDNNSEPATGNAHVRFFHASPDAPAVDIAVVDGPILFSDIEFQEASNYLPVPGDTSYDLEVRLAGTGTVVLTVNDLYLTAGEVYTVFALGTVAPFTLYALPVQDTPFDRPIAHGADLAIDVPAGADFMEVELTVPFEIHDFCYNDPNPYSICYSNNQRWSLTVFDWTDRNENEMVWLDANGDEVVSYWTGDVIEVGATGAVTETELNRFNYAYNVANIQGATVRLGERDDIDNIIIGLVHRYPNDTRWMGSYEDTVQFYEDNPLQVKVVFYEKVDWPIVATSAASVTVPAGGQASFDATFTIPNDPSLYGVHEGAITVGEAIVPVTVNVAVPADEMLFTLGGNEASGTPYDNSRMGPGYTWTGVYEEGDWRFYYYDAETGLDQQYLYVRNQWGDTCGNMPTFNETLVWGPNFGDQFSLLEPDKYGPYGLQYAGGTWDAYGPQAGWGSPRRGDWWSNGDGIAQPESRTWATLWDGLNQVQFRNVLMSGKHSCGEGFEATAGVFGVDAPETGIIVNSDLLSGTIQLDAISPVDGLIAYAAGFGQEEWFRNQDVPQGKHYEAWPEDLMSGWVYTFEVDNSWGFTAETFGPWTSDVDLYLLYDANKDGLFNIWDNRERLSYSRNWGSNEYIGYWGDFNNGYQVQDGTYALVMYGYWIDVGDQFDLRLQQYGGDKLNVVGANSDNNFVMDVTAGELQNLAITWEVPTNGIWQGMLWFGMPWEESPQYYSMGPGFYVPVSINAGGALLSRTQKQVDKETALLTFNADESEVLTYHITIVNDGTEEVYVQMADLLPEGTAFHEQFVQDPDQPVGQGWWYVGKWWYEFGQESNPIEYFWPGEYCYGGTGNDNYLCWHGRVGPSTSGKVHIEYQVKILPKFGGVITNKADFFVDGGENYHEFFSRTATTQILRRVFMPFTFK
jgi:hypothetical protein